MVAEFSPTSVVCVERPVGAGVAVTRIGDTDPVLHWATIGLRVEPGAPSSGVRWRLAVERGSLPAAFLTAIEETVRAELRARRIVDCVVTLTHSGFCAPVSTASDFRALAPLVLADALRDAGTVVCQPWDVVDADIPETALRAVLDAIVRVGGLPEAPAIHDGVAEVRALLPSAVVPDIERALPGLTGGLGVLSARFGGYRAV